MGAYDGDTVSSLAGRLARLNNQLSKDEQQLIKAKTGGIELTHIIGGLFNAIDADMVEAKALELAGQPIGTDPGDAHRDKAQEILVAQTTSLFTGELIELIDNVRRDHEQTIDHVDETQWVTLGADVKGDIYEGILERNAEDTKSGAGQYFTPRALIKAMVECMRPEPNKTIADPACGTGGFFLAAYDYLLEPHPMDKSQKAFLKHESFFGNEIVAGTRRLCLMNMFLHNIGEIDGDSNVSPNDALIMDDGKRFDYVLANPPFGKKSSISFTNEAGEQEKDDLTYNRQDFWATTSNKQLNFVQHIRTMLKTSGRAAVVVPDNVLFEGGAGETVRKKLLETTELHTILRLPTGIFYANGVKANVLFFDNHEASKEPWTKEVWFYDYRTNIHHTLKKKPLRFDDLEGFIKCYNPQNRHERKELWNEQSNPEGRWRKFSYEQIIARDKTSLDIFWLKDKSLADLDNLPEPDVLADEIIQNIEAGLESFRAIAGIVG